MWCICNIRVWIPAMGTNNGHDNVSLYDPSKRCFKHLSYVAAFYNGKIVRAEPAGSGWFAGFSQVATGAFRR
jgi:hypothetical protein